MSEMNNIKGTESDISGEFTKLQGIQNDDLRDSVSYSKTEFVHTEIDSPISVKQKSKKEN